MERRDKMDAVGSVLSSGVAQTNTQSINQNDFIKLFLTQLNFQDPMQPVDNREFLAQIAQFSALEQSRQIGESINDLVTLNSTSQSLSLLGKYVEVTQEGGSSAGTVRAVNFTTDGPMLTVALTSGGTQNNVRLSEINLAR
jgi:flagellar basal-body rod modification protein FlgD